MIIAIKKMAVKMEPTQMPARANRRPACLPPARLIWRRAAIPRPTPIGLGSTRSIPAIEQTNEALANPFVLNGPG